MAIDFTSTTIGAFVLSYALALLIWFAGAGGSGGSDEADRPATGTGHRLMS